jgi:hypothetical protein
LGHIIIVSTISANGCQLTAATRTGLPNASLRLEPWLDDDLRADNGLTLIDYRLLLLLAEAPQQRRRMSELADRMVFSRSRITYQVSSMTTDDELACVERVFTRLRESLQRNGSKTT